MKTRYKISLQLMLAAGILILGSCKKSFLDNESKQSLTDETQFASENNADIYVNDLYGSIWKANNSPDQLDNYTDDNDAGPYWPSWNWRQGIVTPSTNVMTYNGFDGNSDTYASWEAGYTRIRKCNLFLQKAGTYGKNFSADWIAKRTDEVRFLRAFTYTYLMMHFGGLPIITQPQDRLTDTDISIPRSSFEETANFITTQLDSVYKNQKLAIKYNQGDVNTGRATLGAALALKGWVELFAASPAFNTATPADNSGATAAQLKLVAYGNYDVSRWKKAAATNKLFIDTYAGAYQLFPDLTTFWTEGNEYNSEVIFDRQQVRASSAQGSNYEVFGGGPVYVAGNYINWGNYCPTQELVDQFPMANGKFIDDPGSGYNPQNPYANRDKRFYNDIVYDGAQYKINTMAKADIIYTRIDKVNPSLNQIDLATSDVSNTAYYSKKRVNPDITPGFGAGNSGLNYVFMRYAEVLLNYAEAQNEATGPDATVYTAIDQIRRRAGTATLEQAYGGQGLNQAQMREVIRRERRVELNFENKRFYDVIRWAVAGSVMNKDRHGMKITNTVPASNGGVWQYDLIELNHPHSFQTKMYFNPIPQSAIDRNQQLIQNPGY